MLNSTREVYDSWDLTIPEIPKRSSLYKLEPIGIGTPYVESLTGLLISSIDRYNHFNQRRSIKK